MGLKYNVHNNVSAYCQFDSLINLSIYNIVKTMFFKRFMEITYNLKKRF